MAIVYYLDAVKITNAEKALNVLLYRMESATALAPQDTHRQLMVRVKILTNVSLVAQFVDLELNVLILWVRLFASVLLATAKTPFLDTAL